MREKIGLGLLFLGTLTADSEWLLVPLALLIAGAVVLRKTIYKGDMNE